jgi:hypothetical protein
MQRSRGRTHRIGIVEGQSPHANESYTRTDYCEGGSRNQDFGRGRAHLKNLLGCFEPATESNLAAAGQKTVRRSTLV